MMMNRRIFPIALILLVLLGSCAPAAPQPAAESDSAQPEAPASEVSVAPLQAGAFIRFQNISIEEGLSQSVVNAMAQDKTGFLWLGTQDGLNRYDGYRFTLYKPIPGDPNSLSDSWVTSLFADGDGSLWVGTNQGGLNRYEPQTGKFTRYQNDPQDASTLTDGSITTIFRDSESILWVGTSSGLNRFDPVTGKFARFQNREDDSASISDNVVTSIFQDSKGRLWIGTKRGLNLFDRESQTFTHYFSKADNPRTLSYDEVDCITEDWRGNLWIGTRKGLNRFNPETRVFFRYLNQPNDADSLTYDSVTDVLVDRGGNLWVSTDDGLDRYDAAKDKFIHFRSSPLMRDSLSADVMMSIFEDREGLLWFGTWGGGVNKYDPAENQFAFYPHDPRNPESIANGGVFSIFADKDGIVWVGIYGGGVDRFDSATGKFTHFTHDLKNPNSIASQYVWDILRDKRGVLWFATSNGLDEYDEAKNEFIHHTFNEKDPDSVNAKNISAIYEDRSGNLWVGTRKGLDRYDRETGKFIHYIEADNKDAKTPVAINHITEDRRGDLWVTTSGAGLYRFDKKLETFERFYNEKDDLNALANNLVSWVYEDKQNILWIATMGSGLNRYDLAEKSFRLYTEQDGLSNNFIYCIIPDEEGFLWLTTNYGISRFDPETETFRNYTANDGLQGNEFNSNACARADDGSMYAGGLNGINRFFPKDIHPNSYPPPVTFTLLTSEGSPLTAGQSADAVEAITLKYPRRSFEFELSALSFSQPDKNQYAYQLEGFDEGWYTAGTNRAGRYSNLPGGEYTLRVKASNPDGVWNEKGASVKITVIPPFWKTWWFYSLTALILLAGIFNMYRYRVHSVENQKRELERQVNERAKEIEHLFEQTKELAILEERNRLARDLHDSAKQKAFAALAELGAARSLASGNQEKAAKHLQEAETLVGEVIQEITFLIQEIHPAALKEKGLASTLREYIFEWSSRTGVHVELDIESGQRLPLQIEQALYRSIQEALANVARHSGATSVSLTLTVQSSGVNVVVSDDGRGFDVANSSSGMGLRSIRERVESIGGVFGIESAAGQGTRLTMQIPIASNSQV